MLPGERSQRRAAWPFLAPALILIGVFFFLPVIAGLALSVTDFDLYAIGHPENVRFIGLANYQTLAHTALFWTALKNTLYFAFVGAPTLISNVHRPYLCQMSPSVVWRVERPQDSRGALLLKSVPVLIAPARQLGARFVFPPVVEVWHRCTNPRKNGSAWSTSVDTRVCESWPAALTDTAPQAYV